MISSLAFPSGLVTDVGGPPGFSGTGYVDYLKRLSVVHVGSYSNEEINEFPEQRLSSYEKGFRAVQARHSVKHSRQRRLHRWMHGANQAWKVKCDG